MTAPLDRTSLADVLAAYDQACEDRDEAKSDYVQAMEDLDERQTELDTSDAERDGLFVAVVMVLDAHPGAFEALRLAVDKADPNYRQPVKSPWTGR